METKNSNGLELPNTMNKMDIDKNITTGTKGSLTNTKNHVGNMVKTASRSTTKGTSVNPKKPEDTKDQKKVQPKSLDDAPEYIKEKIPSRGESTKGRLMQRYITPLREGSEYNDRVLFAQVEQLLQESKPEILTEESPQRYPSMGAGANTGNKGTEQYMQTGQKATTEKYNQAVSRKIDDDRERKNANIRNASKIEPQMTAAEQTLGIKAPIQATRANAMAEGARNHERSLDMQAEKMQNQKASNG